MTNTEAIKAIDAEIKRQEVELQRMREELAAITAREEHNSYTRPCFAVLMDAVLDCPHTITADSVTLHFSQTQKDGHNALSQLRYRLAAYDLATQHRKIEVGELADEFLTSAGQAPESIGVRFPAPLYDPRDVAFSAPQAVIEDHHPRCELSNPNPQQADARNNPWYRYLRNAYWGDGKELRKNWDEKIAAIAACDAQSPPPAATQQPQSGRYQPNRNVQPPPYQIVTEGYDPYPDSLPWYRALWGSHKRNKHDM